VFHSVCGGVWLGCRWQVYSIRLGFQVVCNAIVYTDSIGFGHIYQWLVGLVEGSRFLKARIT